VAVAWVGHSLAESEDFVKNPGVSLLDFALSPVGQPIVGRKYGWMRQL
jgi:hypothetical protein